MTSYKVKTHHKGWSPFEISYTTSNRPIHRGGGFLFGEFKVSIQTPTGGFTRLTDSAVPHIGALEGTNPFLKRAGVSPTDVLFRVRDKTFYIITGDHIISFSAPDPIVVFGSHLEASTDISYPYALGSTNAYFLHPAYLVSVPIADLPKAQSADNLYEIYDRLSDAAKARYKKDNRISAEVKYVWRVGR